MVVLHTQASTSEVKHKKNRRKMAKKPARIAPAGGAEDSEDQEMEEQPPAAEGSNAEEHHETNWVDGDDDVMIDTDTAAPPTVDAPAFPPLPASAQRTALKSEIRRIPIPPHRMTPLKKDWVNIFSPLTEMLQLQVRMNVQRKCVEIRTSKHTKDIGAIQKGADFVKAYALGFDVNDSIALLRLDDLYLDSFEIKDVKTLHGDHLSRAIGRIAGQDGKTKFTIENASRTRIVLADTKIHILGSFQNIKIARDAIVSLILGSPPGKVYAGLRTVSARMRQRAM
ncbi:eukaryotic type KH-domain (KH-domain type I) [Lentinus tigrinus ALCF2SS1-7]|uniref:Pre-rRNA-processing protein PNO1 n=1 Tax=Lentinus tigrinus ALCF2SS1-6 TaxID=1328759 RepID=A0A5C2SSP1_9APHY|nr:eukaryotic type KH-domain (KH-domain type I) [Lentinus tigrinus ALCF2SS1-6]RPD80318.1 eukaryotic type KH-domain (KH-domain type I) [Lentinus tigrinus ALCF2SS1-7]